MEFENFVKNEVFGNKNNKVIYYKEVSVTKYVKNDYLLRYCIIVKNKSNKTILNEYEIIKSNRLLTDMRLDIYELFDEYINDIYKIYHVTFEGNNNLLFIYVGDILEGILGLMLL